MIQINQSTQLRSPTPDSTDEGKIVYIAMLERKILFYLLRDLKMRAALEIATGVPYDSTDLTELTFDQIEEIISQDMARGLNISLQEARERVSNNKVMSNPNEV